MKSIVHIMLACIYMLAFNACNAQIKNQKVESVHIYGNCGTCETTIEKAGNIKKVAKVDWSKDSKMATLTYDSTKTNQDEILKRIALSGYDNDKFRAPDDVYAELPECCQYERSKKVITYLDTVKTDVVPPIKQDEIKMPVKENISNTEIVLQKKASLKPMFEMYFEIKNALVKSDAEAASSKASLMLSAINAVEMESLTTTEHKIWMTVLNDLKKDVTSISTNRKVADQRNSFTTLSRNMYALLKASKLDTPTYLQHCPMYDDGKGADWLSQENVVKNPYYGAEMLSCGKVTEIIK